MKRNNCTKCEHFTSFMEFYEDESADENMGFCALREEDRIVDDNDTCKKFEPLFKKY